MDGDMRARTDVLEYSEATTRVKKTGQIRIVTGCLIRFWFDIDGFPGTVPSFVLEYMQVCDVV